MPRRPSPPSATHSPALGHQPIRIGGIRPLIQKLAAGERAQDAVFQLSARGSKAFPAQTQVPALLEAFDIPYVFSDPLTLALALDKAMAKQVVRDLGVPTADFAVIESENDIAKIDLPFPLFLKPVAEGSGRGVDAALQGRYKERTGKRGARSSRALPAARVGGGIFARAGIHRRHLPAPARRATVLGVRRDRPHRKIHRPWLWLCRNKEDLGRQSSRGGVRGTDDAAKAAGEVALAAWRALRCRDGGRADIRLDATGQPRFIEVNPLAGIRPGYSDLCFIASTEGLSYQQLIGKFLDAFLRRNPDLGCSGLT